jgi:hypothetical protein
MAAAPGLVVWYLIEVGGLWVGTPVILYLLSPWWLGWEWDGRPRCRRSGLALGGLRGGRDVGGGEGGLGGAALRGGALPAGAGAEENDVPQRLVVEGPYRYVRNPLYDTDSFLILGAALLTRNWTLLLLAALYLAQLALQLPLEERELEERFGAPCRRYCDLVPPFFLRHRPVKQREFDPKTSGYPARATAMRWSLSAVNGSPSNPP